MLPVVRQGRNSLRYLVIGIGLLACAVYIWQAANAWAEQDQAGQFEARVGIRGLLAGRNPDATELAGTGIARDAQATLYYTSRGAIGVMLLQDMPVLPPSSVYQVWCIDDNGRVDASSVFRIPIDSQDLTVVDISTPRMVGTYTRFLITIEAMGGGLTPSNEVVMKN